MSSARITYTPRPDATHEGEINALAAVYRLILNCHNKKNALNVTSTEGDDTKEGSLDEFRATTIIPD